MKTFHRVSKKDFSWLFKPQWEKLW